jgi:hypothetical protein
MPAGDGPLALSRYEDEEARLSKVPRKTSSSTRVKPGQLGPNSPTRGSQDVDMAPASPRVRKRLDEAMENATVFQPGTCGQWLDFRQIPPLTHCLH